MKRYECAECGKEYDGRSMFICQDDKLRCGKCTDRLIGKTNVYTTAERSELMIARRVLNKYMQWLDDTQTNEQAPDTKDAEG